MVHVLKIQGFLNLIQWQFSPLLYKEDLEETAVHKCSTLKATHSRLLANGVPLKFSPFSPEVWTLNSLLILILIWTHHPHDYMGIKQSFEYLLQSILKNICASCKEAWRIPWADRAGTASVIICFSYEGPCILIFPPKASADMPKQGLLSLSLQVNEMQSSYPALGGVHPFRDGCKIAKLATPQGKKAPGGRAAVGQRSPALQWHLVALREITPAAWALPLPAPAQAALVGPPEGLCRKVFCCSGWEGGVKYWYRFWGCGWLRHHGCEFRRINTGCIDHEMHPQA